MSTDIPINPTMLVHEPSLLAEYRRLAEHLVTEDDEPVDNLFSEKQQRLLTEPLYSNWKPGIPFVAMSNVGMFSSPHIPPYVPDVLLSLHVQPPASLFPKSNRSYFVWEYGKVPEVVVEIVSNREGNEDGDKLIGYAGVGVLYYIIYDPANWLKKESLRFYELQNGVYRRVTGPSLRMPTIGLGLSLWDGEFEGHSDRWLRWTELDGAIIQTGTERADQESERANQESKRADQESERANQESRRVARLLQQMKRLGIKPDETF
jgi:Uma2 family endonuclease